MRRTKTNLVRGRRFHRRAGTATVEFAVSIPLLAVVLTLTYFFGWAMVNQQKVWTSDRYACWHTVRTGAAPTAQQINPMYYGGQAQINSLTQVGAGSATETNFASSVFSQGQAAGTLATTLVSNFPEGLGVQTQVLFPTNVTYWQRFTGAISSADYRDGLEWRWRQASCSGQVVNQMLQSVDGELTAVPFPANNLAQFFRTLYRQDWFFYTN